MILTGGGGWRGVLLLNILSLFIVFAKLGEFSVIISLRTFSIHIFSFQDFNVRNVRSCINLTGS